MSQASLSSRTRSVAGVPWGNHESSDYGNLISPSAVLSEKAVKNTTGFDPEPFRPRLADSLIAAASPFDMNQSDEVGEVNR